MFSIVQELLKTRHELRDVKEQLRALQLSDAPTLSDNSNIAVPTISLFVQYNDFFNQLCDIRQTMTIGELLVKFRQLTGISIDRPLRIRVLSEDGLTTLFFLHQELDRTLESYSDCLKARMILNLEGNDENLEEKHLERSKSTTSSEQNYLFDDSDV